MAVCPARGCGATSERETVFNCWRSSSIWIYHCEAAHTLCGQALLAVAHRRSTAYAQAIRCIGAQIIDRSIGSRYCAVSMELCTIVGH